LFQQDPYLLELLRYIHLNPYLTGGGLVQSAGGWSEKKTLRKGESRIKGDERILGQGDFAETVLKAAQENLDRKSRIRALGYDFNWLLDRMLGIFDITFSSKTSFDGDLGW
jgi:hypothetical protein